MVDESAKYRRKLRADSPRQIIGILVCVIFANVAKDAGWLPCIPAFVLAMTVEYIVDYWIPPRPPSGFIAWAAKVVVLMAYLLAGFWLLPIVLSKFIWRPLAFGVPVFLFCVSTQWIRPLYPVQRDRTWRATLVFSAVLALVLALVGTFVSSGW
jgi:hypothetical protein